VKKILLLTLLAALSAVPAARAAAGPTAAPPAADTLVTFSAVSINGQKVSADRVRAEIKTQLDAVKTMHQGTAVKQQADKRTLDAVLDRIIVRELLVQEARARGLAPTEEEMAKAWEAELKRWGSQEKLEKSCQIRCISPAYLRERVMEDLVMRKLMHAAIEPGIVVTEAQKRAYYDEHLDQYAAGVPPMLRFAHLGYTRPGGHVDALTRLDEFKKRMAAGEPFADLARAYSDHASAATGGAVGENPKPELPFLDEGRTLRPGQFTDPRSDADGIYLYFRERRAVPKPYDEVKGDVGKTMTLTLREERMAELIKDLKAKAKIEYLP
jgi:hypothetical protein